MAPTVIFRPDYLIIGHLTRDKAPDGFTLGGTCAYAGLTAHKLGKRVAVVTSYGPDIPSLAPLDGIQIENIPHPAATTFENVYEIGQRRQKCLTIAAPLSFDHVPPAWQKAPVVHLAPLVQEISPAACAFFEDSLLCVTGQGWLRGRESDGNIILAPHPELKAWLSRIDILVLSLNDLSGDRSAMISLLTTVRLGVETLGPGGCNIYHQGRTTLVPVKSEVEVDPTGAGDIFAAAFFIKYHETGNFIRAAEFANACAALSVRKVGLESIPDLAEIEAHRTLLYGR